MKIERGTRALERIAETINVSLTELPVAAGGTYAQTASGDRPRKAASGLDGSWTVVSHAVAGIPYAETYADSKFGEGAYERLDYESTFEFAGSSCAKRMKITAIVAEGETAREFEHSLSLAFSYRYHGATLEVLPIMGFQVTRLDGEIASMKELPRSGEWLRLAVAYDGSSLTITDGDDVKTLERAES